jgi:hypothetical protein
MLPYQKQKLQALLSTFEARFYQEAENVGNMTANDTRFLKAGQTIIRNIGSIRKQINKM